MNKTLFNLSLLALVSILCSCATTPPIPEEEKTFSSVIQVQGKNKDELYTSANIWFVDIFNNAESVIQFSDKEAGKIAGKYYQQLTVGMSFYDSFQTIQVDIKDEKVRFTIRNPQDIYMGNAFGGRGPQAGFTLHDTYDRKILDAMKASWGELESSLKSHLNSNTEEW